MFVKKQLPILTVLLVFGALAVGHDALAQGPSDFLKRYDRNNNGMIDPGELEGRMGDFLKRMAENNPRLDFSRPVPLDRLTQEFQRMREERMRSGGGSPFGGSGGGGPSGGRMSRGGPSGGFMGRGGPGGGPGGGPPSGRRDRGSSDQSNSPYRNTTIEVEPLVPTFGIDMELIPPSGFGAEADLFTIEVTEQDRREAERAFGYYDRNRDGKIDSGEMGRSRYGSDLPLFDRNRDGYITVTEMEFRYAQRRANNAGGSSTASSGRDSGKSSDKDDDSESAGWRADRDTDRKSYRRPAPVEGAPEGLPDWFPRDDADGDGQVAMAEFSVTWSDSVMNDFSQFDLNQDGIITPQECLKVGAEGIVRGGSVDVTSTDSATADSDSSSADSGSSSADSDSSSSDASSSTTSSRPSPAPSTPVKIDSRYLKYYQSLVAKYDKNGDKVLVKDEWTSMSKDPAAADIDGNGRITVEEYASWSMKR